MAENRGSVCGKSNLGAEEEKPSGHRKAEREKQVENN